MKSCRFHAAALAACLAPLGCFPYCADSFDEYDINGSLVNSDGVAINAPSLNVRIEDANGVVYQCTADYCLGRVDGMTDADGRLTADIFIVDGQCGVFSFSLILPPPTHGLQLKPLPDPAFLVREWPDETDALRIELTEDMVTRQPDTFVTVIDIGELVVPSRQQQP